MKHTKTKPTLLLLAAAALSACLSSCDAAQPKPIPEEGEGSALIVSPSVGIKELSHGTNSNGKEYVVLGFSITPSSTTYRRFTISAAWKQSGVNKNVADYIYYEIDNTNKTFTVV